MSCSLTIVGYQPPDERYRQMAAVFDACAAADIEVPRAVLDFFGGRYPDHTGRQVDLSAILRPWVDEYRGGVEFDLAQIPAGVRVIRAHVS